MEVLLLEISLRIELNLLIHLLQVLVINTDQGVSGVGESCPWVSDNLNEKEVYDCLASRLLGEDPLNLKGPWFTHGVLVSKNNSIYLRRSC